MSSTSHPITPVEAPWRQTFESHMSQMSSPEFIFSTLHPASAPPEFGGETHTPAGTTSKPLPTTFFPRARYCIFRSFWAELPENKHNTAPKNPRAYASDLPAFTTDKRMHKTFELFASSAGCADAAEYAAGSGGGGPCEAVFWNADVRVQWRMKGTAFLVGPDMEGSEGSEESSGVRTVKSELGSRMRVMDQGKVGEWSWGREVTGHFGNVSPAMRGTFANPPPGQPVNQPYDDKNLKLGQKIEDLEHPVARENFRVVVIKPDEVESVDLSDPETARRQIYKFDSSTGSWSHEETWP